MIHTAKPQVLLASAPQTQAAACLSPVGHVSRLYKACTRTMVARLRVYACNTLHARLECSSGWKHTGVGSALEASAITGSVAATNSRANAALAPCYAQSSLLLLMRRIGTITTPSSVLLPTQPPMLVWPVTR